MKEVKAAISKLRARAEMYTKLADALSRLGKFADTYKPVKRTGKRHISRVGRARIAQAQRKRWNKWHKANGAK